MHRTATRVTFTDAYEAMDRAHQMTEQMAAYEIVAKHGGEIEAQYVLMSEGCVLTVAAYPDERASVKAHMEIQQRGGFRLQAQSAYTVEEAMELLSEIPERTVSLA
jgi:uncharacterized protein with GYD domain